jgi:membrane protein required for colicin V production
MSIFDITVVVICLALLGRGIWVGFSRQLAFLLALVVGYLVAGRYHQLLAPAFSRFLANEQLRFLVSFLVILFVIYVAIMLLGIGLKKVMQVTFLGWFDRLMGGVFGLVKGAFFCILLFMLLHAVLDPSSPPLNRSVTVPYLSKGAGALLQIIKDENLREKFLTLQPAIPFELVTSAPVIKPGKAVGRDAQVISEDNQPVEKRGR